LLSVLRPQISCLPSYNYIIFFAPQKLNRNNPIRIKVPQKMSLLSATAVNAPCFFPFVCFGTDTEAVFRLERALGTVCAMKGRPIKGGFGAPTYYVRVSPRPDWLRPFAPNTCDAHTHRYCAKCADTCATSKYLSEH
jgi:hypothetical protein